MVAGRLAFVPESLAALKQASVIHRRVDPVSRTAGIALDKNILTKCPGIPAHVVVGIGKRPAGKLQPRPAQQCLRRAGQRRMYIVQVVDTHFSQLFYGKGLTEIVPESLEGIRTLAGAMLVVVEVQQIGPNVIHGKSNDLPVERLSAGVVAIPVVAIRGVAAVRERLAIRIEQQPAFGLWGFLK